MCSHYGLQAWFGLVIIIALSVKRCTCPMECWFALGLQTVANRTVLAKVGLRLLESGLELSNIPSCLAPSNQSSSLHSA